MLRQARHEGIAPGCVEGNLSTSRTAPDAMNPTVSSRRAAIRRPLAAAVAALCLAVPGGAAAEPLDLRARPVALDPEDRARSVVGALEYRGGVVLSSRHHHFGGLSGLDVSPDGARMTAVSDRGYWITARLIYDDGGRLVGVADAAIHKMVNNRGRPLILGWGDAEDIARLADGRLAVSFEVHHRVLLYPGDGARGDSRARPLAMPPDLNEAPSNGGIEALAALTGGRLLAVTEELRDGAGGVRGWLLSPDGAAAHPIGYRLEGSFHPVSFATLPGGDVLALERRFNFIGGFGARLTRIDGAAIKPGATLAGREIARLDPPLTVDNFEAVAVRRAADGSIRVYLLSDDNFRLLQRTLLLQFRLLE